ncbi:TOM (translocase of outer membrane) complex component [Chytriomyces hyalinus]|nr:TOM (translocase of outer membrane) complex component [Chytriomyces hyalinus]
MTEPHDNIRTVAIAAVSLAAVGLGLWMLTTPAIASAVKVEAKEKKKAKKTSTTKKDANASVTPSSETVALAPVPEAVPPTKTEAEEKTQPDDHVTPQKVSEKDSAFPKELAKEYKTQGNRFFGEAKYADAIEFYTKAIAVNSKDAVFYANRAACHANLQNHEATIKDCDAALAIDPRYIKAIYRRAQAYSSLNKLELALNDYTAICMLEEFKKESSITTTDRILKDLGTARAAEVMKSKTSRLPSETFVKAYMDSFRPKNFGASIVAGFPSELPGDALLAKSYEAIVAKDWTSAMTLLEDALAEEMSEKVRAFALNTTATFCFLKGDISLSMEFLDKSLAIEPNNTNTLIKRASIFMERQDLEGALREYQRAEIINPKDPDLYYHRGQVRFLTGDIPAAIKDYKKSLELDNEFVYAHIQLAVALYKNDDQSGADKTFIKALRKFSGVAEVYNYYGEVLLDQQRFDEALKNFDKAISLDGKSPLPYINKSILYLQYKSDPVQAEQLCKKAAEVDPTCDIAFVQLAQLLIHQNRLEEALAAYDAAINVTRTEPELVNAFSCREACAAQFYVSKQYADVYAKLRRAI